MKNHCCSCCSCHHSLCRKELCGTKFRIRLAGLQDGLGFRLRKLFCEDVEFELDNGNRVSGTIVFVGSNFVELFLKDPKPCDCSESPHTSSDEDKREHPKGTTLLFSIEKIAHINMLDSNPSL